LGEIRLANPHLSIEFVNPVNLTWTVLVDWQDCVVSIGESFRKVTEEDYAQRSLSGLGILVYPSSSTQPFFEVQMKIKREESESTPLKKPSQFLVMSKFYFQQAE
jgi:hypothetical protein